MVFKETIVARYLAKWMHWLIAYLHTQLFLTIVTLPVLLCWGLPFSVMTFLANLVFTPCLLAFLGFSACAFLTELFFLPNAWIIQGLEYTCLTLHFLLNQGSKKWLIGFQMPLLGILLPCAITAFCILQSKFLAKPLKNLVMLAVLFAIGLTSSYFASNNDCIVNLEYHNKQLTIMYSSRKATIVDSGCFCRISSDSWLEYTLLPTLNKIIGTGSIENLIILKPTQRALHNTIHLLQLTKINTLHIPFWHGYAEKKYFTAYCQLKKAALQHKCKLMFLGTPASQKILKAANINLEKKEAIAYNDIEFDGFALSEQSQ